MTCQHHTFAAKVDVVRMTDDNDAEKIVGFSAEIHIHCAYCGTPFQFLGLEPGMDTQGARVSLDGLEARIAITPQGERPSPLQKLAFNVSKFDG